MHKLIVTAAVALATLAGIAPQAASAADVSRITYVADILAVAGPLFVGEYLELSKSDLQRLAFRLADAESMRQLAIWMADKGTAQLPSK